MLSVRKFRIEIETSRAKNNVTTIKAALETFVEFDYFREDQ